MNSGNFGNYRQAFVKTELNGIKTSSVLGKYNITMSLQEVDCNRPMRIRALSFMTKLNDINTSQSHIPSAWSIMYPDTVGESVAKFICLY